MAETKGIEKKPCYDLVMAEIFRLIESGGFRINSQGGEMDGAVLGCCLRILKNAGDIPPDAAHRIAQDLKIVRREVGDSRMFHLGRLVEDTIDNLTRQPNTSPQSLLAARAAGIAAAMEELDPDQCREEDLEMEDPLNSKRYGPKVSPMPSNTGDPQ